MGVIKYLILSFLYVSTKTLQFSFIKFNVRVVLVRNSPILQHSTPAMSIFEEILYKEDLNQILKKKILND